jgi:hypothetical protein
VPYPLHKGKPLNPNLTNGVVDCGYGQSSHSRFTQIWFLAGTFGGPTDRTCTVPRGIALFFPLLNIEFDNVGCCVPTAPPFNYSIQEMKQFAALNQDNPLELHPASMARRSPRTVRSPKYSATQSRPPATCSSFSGSPYQARIGQVQTSSRLSPTDFG